MGKIISKNGSNHDYKKTQKSVLLRKAWPDLSDEVAVILVKGGIPLKDDREISMLE